MSASTSYSKPNNKDNGFTLVTRSRKPTTPQPRPQPQKKYTPPQPSSRPRQQQQEEVFTPVRRCPKYVIKPHLRQCRYCGFAQSSEYAVCVRAACGRSLPLAEASVGVRV